MRILYLLAIFLLSGCVHTQTARPPTLTVDAIVAPDAGDFQTYAIIPMPGHSTGIEFDQYAAQLQSVMDARGYIRMNAPIDADVGLFLAVILGDARTSTHTSMTPMWGQTGYSGSQTSASIYGGTYQSSTTYTPRYGITGYAPSNYTTTSYPAMLQVQAAALTGDERVVRTLWQIRAATTIYRPDLRSTFPIMIKYAAPYIGTDTGGMIEVPMQ